MDRAGRFRQKVDQHCCQRNPLLIDIHTRMHTHTETLTHTHRYTDTQTYIHAHIHLALGAKLWPEWASRRAYSSQTLFYYILTHTHMHALAFAYVCMYKCICMLFFCCSLHLTCQTNNCTQPHKEATQWRC